MKKKIEAYDIEQLKKEIEQWKSKYLRALADYQNLEKRIQAQRSENVQFAARNLINKLLPVLDTLEKAEVLLQDAGLKLAVKQFKDIFKNEGIERIQVAGKKFDPNFMECIEVVEDSKDNEVLEEIRAGYIMSGKIIRAAQVKVGKKTENINI